MAKSVGRRCRGGRAWAPARRPGVGVGSRGAGRSAGGMDPATPGTGSLRPEPAGMRCRLRGTGPSRPDQGLDRASGLGASGIPDSRDADRGSPGGRPARVPSRPLGRPSSSSEGSWPHLQVASQRTPCQAISPSTRCDSSGAGPVLGARSSPAQPSSSSRPRL